jgi:hypothetical protein
MSTTSPTFSSSPSLLNQRSVSIDTSEIILSDKSQVDKAKGSAGTDGRAAVKVNYTSSKPHTRPRNDYDSSSSEEELEAELNTHNKLPAGQHSATARHVKTPRLQTWHDEQVKGLAKFTTVPESHQSHRSISYSQQVRDSRGKSVEKGKQPEGSQESQGSQGSQRSQGSQGSQATGATEVN